MIILLMNFKSERRGGYGISYSKVTCELLKRATRYEKSPTGSSFIGHKTFRISLRLMVQGRSKPLWG